MINRREFLGATTRADAALALTPELLRTLQQSGGQLIQRAIPSTGEKLPIIGFGARPAPRGPGIEFQLDGRKKVTGLILVQGSQRIPLERKQEDA